MYINYGDINFLDYGGCLVQERNEHEFDILSLQPYDDADDLYQFADCYIDITDTWIDRKAVLDFIGMNGDDFDAVQFAIGCIGYYGIDEFMDSFRSNINATRDDVKQALKGYFITSDNLNIEW